MGVIQQLVPVGLRQSTEQHFGECAVCVRHCAVTGFSLNSIERK